ncbi:MAG: hypothetical protein CL943_02140 [Candidatus Diapherotrites archaeon]|uniref:Uncharacterized protein n=1 Tax=Candidatus Iainarchaeum sp. TaxID=3101447 RepID=A0A2D6M0Y6_9ARCH|nr:hypothetical protein [Candidatus Diapherotrites archaeon]|tara:strand:- start:814 stop:1242 length:429 start_codon:yes stop_codon:yes gene_type:complete
MLRKPGRKKIIIAPRIPPKRFLTRLVLRKIRSLPPLQRRLFDVWRRSTRVEYLPTGIPYKITSDPEVKRQVGKFVSGLNQPFILVTTGLSRVERYDVARHELAEWERTSGSQGYKFKGNWAAHQLAIKLGNPRTRQGILKKT